MRWQVTELAYDMSSCQVRLQASSRPESADDSRPNNGLVLTVRLPLAALGAAPRSTSPVVRRASAISKTTRTRALSSAGAPRKEPQRPLAGMPLSPTVLPQISRSWSLLTPCPACDLFQGA